MHAVDMLCRLPWVNECRAHKMIMVYSVNWITILWLCKDVWCWRPFEKIQCSGCCFYLPAQFLWIMSPVTHTSTLWCRKIEFRKKWQSDIWKMTTELVGIRVCVRSVFSAAEVSRYTSNAPRCFSRFLLPFFSSCDATVDVLFLSRDATTTQRTQFSLLISSFCRVSVSATIGSVLYTVQQ